MTYAGRLDPMARGLLLILAGEEVKNKEKYLALGKEYEFEVLFGVATDTYDILGKIQHSDILENVGMLRNVNELEKQIKNNLKYFTGKFIQKYPMYSSRTVKGKQLFHYAREGVSVEIPEREVVVKELKFLKLKTISHKKLLLNIEKRIAKVKGDFRQEEILKLWRKYLNNSTRQDLVRFFIGSFKIKCGSGTYVRSIAYSLGEKMGVGALAFSIKRTKIGTRILGTK
jgi:tRNA pseudouridine(55) synthase